MLTCLKNIAIVLYCTAYLVGLGAVMFIPALIIICIMYPLVPLCIYAYWVAMGFIVI